MIKVLVVDDEFHNRSIVSTMLTYFGCEVMEAEDGVEGEQFALDWQPHLIILDIMMPRQDGFQTCKNIRAKGYQGQIIMLTSLLKSAAATESLQCGADAHYIKPIRVNELQDCINKCVSVPSI